MKLTDSHNLKILESERIVRKILVCLIISAFFTNVSYSQSNRLECNVTYLASEGFIIEAGKNKIMIDALPARRFLHKQNVDKAIIDSIEEAKAPFNDVDIVFVTHRHLDHFDPDLTVQYLEANNNAILVCPKQASDVIKLLGGYYRIEQRIFPIEYEEKTAKSFELQGIVFKALPLPHGPYYVNDSITGKRVNRHADVNNLGYLINLGGFKILHTGDNHLLTREEYEKYKLYNDSIDIAFVESLFWGEKYFYDREDIVNNLINPQNIVLMHLSMGDDLSKVPSDMKKEYSKLIHFSYPLENRLFVKSILYQ